PGLFQADFLDHYKALIAQLEDLGVRSILNVGVPGGILAYPRERPKYAQQLSDAIGGNGLGFEMAFHIGTRRNARQTKDEIDLHRMLVSDGKLLVFFADYKNIAASSWVAAMAMLLRNRGDSLFVARDLDSLASWAYWPHLYGLGVGDATFTQVGPGR